MIVENGTGLPDANSYVTTEYADSENLDRQNDLWADLSSEDKEAHLIKATDFFEAFYPTIGYPLNPNQALQFPRRGGVGVPAKVRKAIVRLALYSATSPLTAPRERGIKETTLKADGIEKSVVYDDATPSDPYPDVTMLLEGLCSRRVPGSRVGFGRAWR